MLYCYLQLYASTVTELDISQVPFIVSYVEQYVQHNLQVCELDITQISSLIYNHSGFMDNIAIHYALSQYLHNLKKLEMNHIGLTRVPGSIGALKKLEVLSLAFNELQKLTCYTKILSEPSLPDCQGQQIQVLYSRSTFKLGKS